MNRLTHFIAAALFLGGPGGLVAGPERIDTKDYKAAPAPAPTPCTWTGFYIGISGGYAWGDVSFVELNETDPAYQFNPDGFVGGGQVGFNLQLWSFLVLGVEGTFAGTTMDGSAEIEAFGERSKGHVDSDWIGTVGGRLGVAFWKNRILAYAKGGAAFTNFNYHTEEVGGSENFNADENRTVPFVGCGLEYAVTCHWSVRVEYNHLFSDSESVTGIESSGSSGVSRTYGADPDFNTFQAGLNFKF